MAIWMRVLLPQVLGVEAAAAPAGEPAPLPVARLGAAASLAALDCLDVALAPGGAQLTLGRRGRPFFK